jgi:hypothetical protein
VAADAAWRIEGVLALQLWETYSHMINHTPKPRDMIKRFGHSYAENFEEYFKAHCDSRIKKPASKGSFPLVLSKGHTACISVVKTGRNPTMRHLGRVHKVDI